MWVGWLIGPSGYIAQPEQCQSRFDSTCALILIFFLDLQPTAYSVLYYSSWLYLGHFILRVLEI
jgi:hypothetical protein